MSTPNLITLSLAGGEKEDQLLLKDLDMEVRYNDLDFEFQNLMGGGVDTVQDFLTKLGIQPSLYILKIRIFSLNHVIVRPTKIMNNLLKVFKICTFKVI